MIDPGDRRFAFGVEHLRQQIHVLPKNPHGIGPLMVMNLSLVTHERRPVLPFE